MALLPFGRQGKLPRVGTTGDDGDWDWKPHAAYERLCQECFEALQGAKKTTNGWAELAVDILAVNYRVNKYVVMSLELLSLELCDKILDLAQDGPEIEKHLAAQKKTEPLTGTVSMSAGDVG
jgi:hypothetical protein